MARLLRVALVILLTNSLYGQSCDLPCSENGSLIQRKGVAAAHSSYDSIAMSMMLWGSGLAIAIAGLSVWLNQSTATPGNNPNHATTNPVAF